MSSAGFKTLAESTTDNILQAKVLDSIGIPQRSPDTYGETNPPHARERKLTFGEAIDSPELIAQRSRLRSFNGISLSSDTKRAVGEMAARYGIRLVDSDPALAIISLNQIVPEQAIEEVCEQLRSRIAEFETSAHQLEHALAMWTSVA